MRWANKERKKFNPKFCSYPIRARKFQKKKQKIKKVNSGIISIQNGLREAEKERKEIYSRIPFILDPSWKIPKNKKQKNSKN